MLAALCLFTIVLVGLPASAQAVSALTQGPVVEQLRVKVPAGARGAWLLAEEESWGPWLQRQDGFLGRDLLWDAEREEGLLLIRWRSRRQWLAIPASEIKAAQVRFEAAARRALAHDPGERGLARAANPFPLVHAGELEWVALTPPLEEEGH
ncbi:putative cyanobacterial protein, TIGR03792 family [Cyanobium gracile PCC 6307]|uniref:Putative cyanobacterial protein, TIGR03792 family n=1 Tax=Cyanobium gracile (strain ATCC 27147 / PCC 6307) TaxID=292564 RepID=K9P5M8_CYAGP|nr:putative cyanobacterial protein, TIGR03792 family [Cyanobium gracile PCC 6307]